MPRVTSRLADLANGADPERLDLQDQAAAGSGDAGTGGVSSGL